jgi:hypothetical protein
MGMTAPHGSHAACGSIIPEDFANFYWLARDAAGPRFTHPSADRHTTEPRSQVLD